MRVLQIAGSYPIPPLGGVEVTTFELAKELARLGHAVRVVSPSGRARTDATAGCEFIGLESADISNWIRIPTPSSLRELRRLATWAEVIHIQNPQELFTVIGSFVAMGSRKPFVMSIPVLRSLGSHPRLLFRWLGRLDDRLVLALAARADLAHVKNPADLPLIARRARHPILLPDGVESAMFSTPRDSKRFREAQGLAERYPVLLYVGRLHPLKGAEDFVRLVEHLRPAYPNIAGILVGPDFEGSIRTLHDLSERLGIAGAIRLLGPLDVPSKIAALDAADVVVVPSLADFVEGFSIVSSEAWARGRPVAGYPVGALRVRIHEGINGCLAARRDVPSLASAVVRALALRDVARPDDVVAWSEVADQFSHAYQTLGREVEPGSSPVRPLTPGAGT